MLDIAAKLGLTVEKIESEVRRLATVYPDTRYENVPGSKCSYTTGHTPSGSGCIFGQALQNLGVPLNVLKEWDDDGDSAIQQMLPRLGLTAPVTWAIIQEHQDNGEEWSTAVAKGLKHQPND